MLLSLSLISIMTACSFAEQQFAVDSSSLENSQSKETESLQDRAKTNSNAETLGEMENITTMKINVQIGNTSFKAILVDNAATRELMEMLKQSPISIDMDDYSGFEKVGSLGKSLTTDNHHTTTSSGDIVLYNGNQIVMFYGSNSWTYTKIGRIENLSGWKEALGSGSITAVFSLEK